MSTTRIRAAALVASGALISGLAVGLAAPAAHAAFEPCLAPATNALAPGEADFDGDGRGDVAYGVPAFEDSGRVVVEQSTRGLGSLTSAGGPDEDAEFGHVVVAQEVDNDHCTDLVVGAPGAENGSGRVYVIFGSATGIGTGRPTLTIAAPQPTAGDRFGQALDATDRWSGDGLNTFVAVGAPRTDVAGAADAGAVHLFGISNDDQLTVDRLWNWTQGAKGKGSAETNDNFGEVVMTRTGNAGVEVIVGVPHEDIGRKTDAGVVNIRTPRDTIVTLSQDTKKVPGKAERNDRFGASLAASGRTLAVGVSHEALGKKVSAGQVQLFTQRTDDRGNRISASYAPGRALSLDTKGVTGKARKHDRLGQSLAVLRGLTHTRALTIAAGMPKRDVGNVDSAGAVALFTIGKACPGSATVCGRVLTQASKGVAGTPGRDGQFGWTLAVDADFGPTETIERRDTLVVGAPGLLTASGRYVQYRPSASALVQDPAGVTEEERFGSTVPARWTAPSLYR